MELDPRLADRQATTVNIILSRREREIIDILYRLEEATVEQVRAELAEALHYSTVGALLRVLEEKGHILHGGQNLRYVYRSVVPKQKAAQVALDQLVTTFFDSSIEKLLRAVVLRMSSEQIDKARKIVNASAYGIGSLTRRSWKPCINGRMLLKNYSSIVEPVSVRIINVHPRPGNRL